MQDIFAVQSEIANTVASALVAEVGSADGTTPRTDPPEATPGATTSVAAYDAYLRGRALYDLSADEASERAALAQFDAAIEADPDYAAAHAARARSLTAIANQYGEVGQLAGLYDAAVASAKRAIAIAPDFAEAHSTLGFTLFQGRLDARAAREPFERSRRLGAGEATVMARYAQYSARIGRDRAAAEAIERALILDPLNPLIHRAAASIEYAARRYAESIPHARKALKLNPHMSRANAAIGDALFMLGRSEEARAAYAAEPVDDFRLTGIAIVEHRLGNAAAANAARSKLVAELGDRVLYQQAQLHAQWGERDAAIERLEQARRDRRFRAHLPSQRSAAGPHPRGPALCPVAREHWLRLGSQGSCTHLDQPEQFGENTHEIFEDGRRLAAASLLLAACAKKEEAAAAPEAAPAAEPAAEPAPPTGWTAPG